MNQTTQVLKTRRSCKKYKSQHVPRHLIDEIVACGLNAPTGRNLQAPIFVVVTNDSVVAKLSKLNADVMGAKGDPFYGAKDVIVVLASKVAHTYVYDGSVAMTNLMNSAYSLGVGSCWIHRAKEVFYSPEGKQLLAEWGITDDVEGVGFCVLGYPDGEPVPKTIKDGRVYFVD
ncbi:MAG: nitroreductase [Clostridia bacterium]|nr:nitroreductase [Clostridia bacterium]